MSRSLQPPVSRTRHLCTHPRCKLLDGLSGLCYCAAYVALSAFLGTGRLAWIVIGTGAVLLGCAARYWPHPRAGGAADIEALADATREDPWDPVLEEWGGDLR